MNLNNQAKKVYENNVAVGWWDGEQCLYQKLQLISTEVAEATEGERKNLMDDHLPHRKMGEVELADALIRTLDFGGRMGYTYTQTVDDIEQVGKDVSTWSVGKRHLGINAEVIGLADSIEYLLNENHFYSGVIDSILVVAASFGYDVISAMEDKLEYNKKRADHKKENREKENGKQF